MKILIASQEQWQELSNNLIVICMHNRKDNNEVVYGIDLQYKDQYPDFEEVEVLSQDELFWHDDTKSIKLYQTIRGFIWSSLNMSELGIYRRDNNIVTYEENDGFYFYVNNLLPEHRELFESNSNLEITITEK